MSNNRDSEKFNKLDSELMIYLRNHDPRALDIIRELADKGMKNGDSSLIGYAYYRYAYYYYFISKDIHECRRYVQLAIKYLLRCDNSEYLAGAYNLIAYDAQDQGCYDVAYAYFMTAAKTAEEGEVNTALPGLIEASAGKLLILLGDTEEGREQSKKSIRMMNMFPDMHVYNYNVIVTYADIALASFLMNDLSGIEEAEAKLEEHYANADSSEKEISESYRIITGIYKALISGNEKLLDKQFAELDDKWKALPDASVISELTDMVLEMEAIFNYMIKRNQINRIKNAIALIDRMDGVDNTDIALRYNNLKVMCLEKIGDRQPLRRSLYRQNELRKKAMAETMEKARYSMEFSDMIGAIVKERKKAEEENIALKKQVNTDFLTGLPNRNAITAVLEERYAEALENGTSFGIGIIDVDDFKVYNDVHGHQAGDECLKSIGNVLLSFMCRDELFCGRYGGDEFIVGYFGMTDEEIRLVKEEMDQEISLENEKATYNKVIVSQGVFNRVPGDDIKLWDYLTFADKELYIIKKTKNQK